MKRYLNNKRIVSLFVIAALCASFGMTGCNEAVRETEPDPKYIGTPEVTVEPASDIEDIIPAGDKDYYIPFQNPDHCYCTVNEGFGVPVRTQGLGGCYCYAAVASLQSNYRKTHGELIDINPKDIIYRIYESSDSTTGEFDSFDEEKYYVSYGTPDDYGGDYHKVTGAICADPLNGYFAEETDFLGIYNMEYPTAKTIYEDDIKAAVREHGAVCISVSFSKDCKMVHGYYTQNYAMNAFDTDHVAVIVGWDDDFPADCFENPASRNGAWLVQNSFGEIWGNCGYYWVSYDMAIPGVLTYSVTNEYSSAISYGKYVTSSVIAPGVMEKIGKDMDAGRITYDEISNSGEVSAATVYEEKGKIGAIGIWTTFPGQKYTIEIRKGEFGKVVATATGSFDHSGYHTVKFDKPVSVNKFTVVVKVNGEAAFEGAPKEDKTYTPIQVLTSHYEAKTEHGRSFVQIGEEWVDVTDPDIMKRLGVEGIEYYEGLTTVGDPCITVLFV